MASTVGGGDNLRPKTMDTLRSEIMQAHEARSELLKWKLVIVGAIGEKADSVSRWILAEAAPLAMPDSRWDKMVYGIRDCEEFLNAVT